MNRGRGQYNNSYGYGNYGGRDTRRTGCYKCNEQDHYGNACPNVGKVKLWLTKEQVEEWQQYVKDREMEKKAKETELLVTSIVTKMNEKGGLTKGKERTRKKSKKDSSDEEEDDEEVILLKKAKELKKEAARLEIRKLEEKIKTMKNEENRGGGSGNKARGGRVSPRSYKKGSRAKGKEKEKVRSEEESGESEAYDEGMKEYTEGEDVTLGVQAVKRAFEERKTRAGKGYVKTADAVRLLERTVKSPERRADVVRRLAEEFRLEAEEGEEVSIMDVAKKLNL